MKWTSTSLKNVRTSAKLSQSVLADALGVHYRTIQNWENGTTQIPTSVIPALDRLFCESQEYVPKEDYDKVVAALNQATELNHKLTEILNSNNQSKNNK